MNSIRPSTLPLREAACGNETVQIIGRQGRRATGVAIQADPFGGGFHLVLVSGTRALLALGPYSEEDIMAEWRSLGATTGLPLLIRLSNGSTLTLVSKIGQVSVGSRLAACRKAPAEAIRPRFLAHRRQGRLAAAEVLRN